MTETILFSMLLLSGSPAVTTDSLRLETIDGKSFIIHRIDPRETLFSISRRYKVPVADLKAANPGSEDGIAVGKSLRVPYAGSKQVPVKKPGQSSTTEQKAGTHIVTQGQTLFAVARQYDVTVAQLKSWNNLAGTDLREGQQLIIREPAGGSAPSTQPPMQKPADKPVERISPGDSAEKKETGTAILMEGSEEGRKYLALHKSIPYGTVVRVRNAETRLEVFVRVVGSPGETAAGTILKISKAAMDRLGGTDRVPVELIYYP
jgi:LysM repeat protein